MSDVAMLIMPVTDIKLGCSSVKINQLRQAPRTGIINFQVPKVETFIFGFRKIEYHIVKAAAERKLSHSNAK